MAEGEKGTSLKQWCPVGGYDFGEPIRDSMICRCCGTQFGYHDSARDYAALRERWQAEGSKWHSRRVPPPPGWSAEVQWAQAKRAEEASTQQQAVGVK